VRSVAEGEESGRDSLHALRGLPGHIDAPHGVELRCRVGDVQVSVQTAAVAPLRDDGEVGLGHVAHEEQDVDVASLPASPGRGGGYVTICCSYYLLVP